MTNKKKHILILPRWYPNKNDIQLGVFIKNQALLVKNNFTVSIIYVQSDNEITNKYQVLENKEEGIHEQIVYFKKSTSIFKKIVNFSRYKKAQQMAYENLLTKVDLCHVHVPIRPFFLAHKLLKRDHIPYVVTEHWSGHLNGKFNQKSKLYKSLYRKVLRKAHKVSCVSLFLKERFQENTGTKPLVIPNYIEKLSIEQNQNKTSKQIDILSVNDLIDKTKNVSGLLKSFKLAIIENPQLRLTLVGGGPDEQIIKDSIRSLDFEEGQVILLGRLPHEKVLKQMTQCDFYVSNSNFETFGMTICEALLSGKPVISTLSGGPNEFLNEGNSISIEKGNPIQLKDAILKMSNVYSTFNPHELSNQIEKKYGRESVLKKTTEFYTT